MLSGAEGRGANDLTLIYFHKKNVVRRNQDIKDDHNSMEETVSKTFENDHYSKTFQ
jgi:hypothetical protein